MTNNTASFKDVFPATTTPSKDRPLRLKMTHSRRWPTGHDPEIICIQKEGCSSTGLELKRYPRKYRKPIELVWKTTQINENVIAALAVVENDNDNKTASYEGKTSIVAPTNKAMTIVYGSEANSNRVPKAFGNGSTLLYPQANIRMVKRSGNYTEYASETEIEQLLVGKDESRYYQSKEVPGPKGPRIEIRQKKSATAALAILEDTSASPFSDTIATTIMIVDPGSIDPCLVLCLAADTMNRKSYSIQHDETQQQLIGLAAVCCSVM